MDKETFKERVGRLKEIDSIIKKLDSSIKEHSFKLLQNYITDIDLESGAGANEINDDLEGKEKFFQQFDHKKPSDNVLLIAAYYYNQYGTASMSAKEIKEIADSVGITVPNRVDKTLDAAKRDKKSLFVSVGKGKYKPTVSAETFFKTTYKVKKGKKKNEVSNAE